MNGLVALGSGLVGALAVTAVHELARRNIAAAPRMDIYGERAIDFGLRAAGRRPIHRSQLHEAALVGDLASNALYYSLVATGDPEHAPQRGAALGLAAGVGALVLPPPLGLGTAPSNRTSATQAMTIAWYTIGGLAAGLAYRALQRAGYR